MNLHNNDDDGESTSSSGESTCSGEEDHKTDEAKDNHLKEDDSSFVMMESQSSSPQENEKTTARDDPKTPNSQVTDSSSGTDGSSPAEGTSNSDIRTTSPFYTNENGESYYSRLQISSQRQHYAVKRTPVHDNWTIAVGDLVAVAYEDSSKPTSTNTHQPWHPFLLPWSAAQVVALSCNSENEYLVHVCWFYRRNDFVNLEKRASPNVKRRLVKDDCCSLASKIVYESSVYDVIDVNSILGRVVLTSEDAPYESFFSTIQGKDGIPQAPLVCRSLISPNCKSITDITHWNRTCTSDVAKLQRGLNEYVEDDQGLVDATMTFFQKTAAAKASTGTSAESPLSLSSTEMSTNNGGENVATDASPLSTDSTQVPTNNDGDSATDVSPLSEAPAKVPTKSDYDSATDVSPSSEAPAKVSVKSDKPAPPRKPSSSASKKPSAKRTKLPRKVAPNKKKRTTRSKKDTVPKAPTRTMPTRGTKRAAKDPPTDKRVTRAAKRRTRDSPVVKKRPTRGTKRSTQETPSTDPTDKTAGSDTNSRTVRREHIDATITNFVNDNDSARTEPSPRASMPPARTETASSPASTVTKEDDRIFIPDGLLPFHQDFAALRSYYSEIEVVPPLYNYVDSIRSSSMVGVGRWTVKMGDVVAVHYRQGAGRISFGSANEINNDTHFPYTVPWAIAEVVTIWKEHDSVDEMNNSQKKTSASAVQDDVMIEIRWFYRKGELPGASKTATISENAAKHLEYEEIFETDLMDHCDATSLLSPAKLHESAKREGLSKTQQGMPLIDVHCCQFFSIHRKALLPIGGMSGRIERGRMHSKYFGRGGVLNLAWNQFKNNDAEENEPTASIHTPKKWKQAFKDVIERLGLSAASDDASVQGIQLTGREAEQEKIMTFLRSRIAGSVDEDDDDDDSEDEDDSIQSNIATNASLFIAGPPGTGKTASVHSVIARLRKEQAKGKLPAFDFVSLNGMEMRHPFEAYVKFWEMISGPSKQKCPPEVAVAKLERHFAGRGKTDEDDENSKQIVVLLLDEIDYLVTKKQTVLYNFFDWPRRTCENGCGPRLIVVGISNTLNLPSRLKPSVQSRLGSETCGYKSYNVKDMIAILKTKIQSDKADDAYQVFEDDAIQFAARKTAALSGDIRKALHLCKAAAEAVMKDVEAGNRVDPKEGRTRSGPIVRISDVQKASRESFSSILSTAVSFSSTFEALLLVSLASLTLSTGRHDGGFDINELITKMESIAGGSGDVQYSPPPSFGETLEMLNRLGETRLVSLHTPKSSNVTFRAAQGGSGGAWPLISLPMDPSNLRKALRDTPHNTLAEKYITTY